MELRLDEASAFVVRGHKERVEASIRAIQEVVLTRGPAAIQESIGEVVPLPVDRGTYRRGWRFVRLPDGAQIFSTTPYASVIERGRRPGERQPPTEALAGWVKRKGLVKGRGGDAERAARQMAFVVARAIKRRGQPARWVLRRAMARLRPEVERALELAAARAVE